MLAAERRNQILEELHEKKKVLVSELTERYQVSDETIRRDLERFEKEGIAIKSYGGAVLNDDNQVELPFQIRQKKNTAQKQRIGELALALVPDGASIFLDASSTSVFIARSLCLKKDLTIITSSMEILMELSKQEDFKVIGTGGILNAERLSFSGARAVAGARAYHTDFTFVSCKGVDIKSGITDFEEEQADMVQTMLSSADKRILAADSSKFGQKAFVRAAEYEDIDYLITDCRPDETWLEFLGSQDITCIYK